MSLSYTLPDNAFNLPAPLQTVARRVPWLNGPLHFAWRLSEHWTSDHCPLKAAAMAFFGLFSIFPIVLAAVVILAQILAVNQEVLASFQNFVEEFFPGRAGEDISRQLEQAVTSLSGSNTTAIGVVALASLLWSGRAFFATLATVLNDIWPQARPRSFLQQQLVMWTTFVAAGALWLLSTVISLAASAILAFVNAFRDRLWQYAPDVIQPYLESVSLADVLSRGSSWLLTTLMFWLIYWFLPNIERGRSKCVVLVFASLAAAAWEVARILYAGFLGNMTNFTDTYGSSVASVIGTMMWIYFSSLILLLGAEAAATYQETCEYLSGELKKASQQKRLIKFVPHDQSEHDELGEGDAE